MRLLYVEDNEKLARNTCAGLRQAGFRVDVVSTGGQAVRCVARTDYDAAILDLGLPDMDGLVVLARIRQVSARTPVLVCTARDTLEERVRGMAAGSDEYLVKPFDITELIARIRTILRRPGGALGMVLRAGSIRMDTAAQRIEINGLPVCMSRQETTLLTLFMRHKGRVLTRDAISTATGCLEDPPAPGTIDQAMHALRDRLATLRAGVHIHSLRGIGFIMEDDEK